MVAVCHPEWRGVRVAAYGFRVPVVEVADAEPVAADLVARFVAEGVATVVVHGFPPGTDELLRLAAKEGLATRCVLHSSPAQHGAEAGEAAVADRVLALAGDGVIDRVGFVKEGVAEALGALGHRVAYVPNRVPRLPELAVQRFGDGLDVGVFAEPFWRKNVVTQLAAAALLDPARVHVLHRPDPGYLGSLPVVEHGVLPWEEFIAVQSSVDLNLYVTLSECQPLTPMESYAAGVPCLMSPTSALFRDDPDLWELTTVAESDNPRAIAAGATRLLAEADAAVAAARQWLDRWDGVAAARWQEFVA